MTTRLLEKSPLRASAERIAQLADQCVQCGLCPPVGPVQHGELPRRPVTLPGPSPRRPRWLLELIKRPVLLRAAPIWVTGSRCRAGKVRWRGACQPLAATLDPQLLLLSNIGCRLHLTAGIDAQGPPWPTRHPLTLLTRQLEPPPSNQERP